MMKTFVPNKVSILVFICLSVFSSTIVLGQGIPQLQFTNAVLESGNAGQDGATYRFSNVTSGVDALVEIKGRSSADVVLSSIDTSGAGLGYDKAFQPVLGIPGVAPALSNWSMDFEMHFVETGSTKKKKLSQFNVTGLDIDGDGMTLSEWTQMKGIQSVDSALVNSLTFTKIAQSGHDFEYKVEGIIANSPGIDTTAKNVMATYKYVNTDEVDFTIGAKTSILPTTAGMRLNSIWFKDFLGVVLPVKLISFNAALNENTVDLTWTTASEMNVSHFVIEKSADGKKFEDAGTVTANGNTTSEMTYSFTDLISQHSTAAIYYRVRSVDNDNKFDYSQTKIIKMNADKDNNVAITSYPNPVSNELHVTLPLSWQNKSISFGFIQTNGQVIKEIRTTVTNQMETFSLNGLAPGMYVINISCDGMTKQQKIIKS